MMMYIGYVMFEIFTAVTINNAIFWAVTPCGSCNNRCLEGTYRCLLRNVGLTRATLRHILEDGFLHSHRRKNLKSYIALTGWTL
jgi:hypothetical protein